MASLGLAGAPAAAECTYGGRNAQWLSQELPRLLSMQRNLPGNGLVLSRGSWSWDCHEACHYQFRGVMRFSNMTRRHELFIAETQGKLQLLSRGSVESIKTKLKILSRHPGNKPEARNDRYWPAYITRAGESTSIEVVVDVESHSPLLLSDLQAVCVEMEYVCYGPHGRTNHSQHVVLPTHYPDSPSKASEALKIQPIYTHLLCHLDDPLEVLKRYALPYVKPGDVIAIGETPLAIMQGRYRHPTSLQPGLLAKLVCRLFHPTSSLATACGMQALIDISGKLRIVFAVVIAVIARTFVDYLGSEACSTD
ncbi:uncharacterized protein LOC112343386 isoform X1 [Selaginella moellendorffii]|uniref:uncharacterized protein LOC112343386 isoform X1 n=1 Tax=Selaginella moellendorffii TaxID=88036 RepID=UPI000D1C72FE|nr:uncharacterized protein LOC112343386 isoform X1 [Selaginella moellendorffii]|eukprot:XP_024522509.1 uncharacterized protein LOC112343386 isoform X1 [Selaginella moellendorffii]